MFTKLKEIKLKKSEKRAIKLGLIVVVFVILFNLVIYPLYQSYNQLKTQKIKYTKNLIEIEKKIKEAKSMLKQANTLKKKYESSKSKLIQSKNIELAQVFLEETITDYAKDRNLNIVRIYKERAKDENGLKVVKARVTVKGEYPDIIDFLNDIERDEHYLYAESVIIRYYRGIEAVVSVKGIIQLTEDSKDKQSGGKK
ncbi:hypothetical protein TTHT_1465 [Thermotomaculum hydrothermale]|uniref:Uncharacterized protein n=1 Tax=Thermotomaculum hydrothermale TaxID=981385 RepID=A0A7R6PFV6_9BACT|nr:hypothetical protein [Thermotomaculum hydrothermale]BBB32973.1 hypothetical protein TTHT_1465 [Thermotomaculum hydrothermale]